MYLPQASLYHFDTGPESWIYLFLNPFVDKSKYIFIKVTNLKNVQNLNDTAFLSYQAIQKGEETWIPESKDFQRVALGNYTFTKYVYMGTRIVYSTVIEGYIGLEINMELNNDKNFILEAEKVIKTIKIKGN